MNDPIKFYETETTIFYSLNGNEQGLVAVPKDLKNNIKVFMTFKDKNQYEQDKNNLFTQMQDISKKINQGNNDGIFIVALVEEKNLVNENTFTYFNELGNIKKLVNIIYNKILGSGNLRKENFIKKAFLLSFDGKYSSFINWLCMQNPSKFSFMNYQQLLNNNQNKVIEKTEVFINQNAASIFNEPNRQSAMMAMQSNIKPITETLSIGTPRNIPTNINNRAKTRTLVKPTSNHGSAAFIKWYTALFILVASIVIGITISIVLVK